MNRYFFLPYGGRLYVTHQELGSWLKLRVDDLPDDLRPKTVRCLLCTRVCVCVCQSLSCVWLFVTPWTVAHQAALSVGFSRQDYWSGLLFSSPGIFPTQGLNPGLLDCRRVLYCLSHCGSPWEGCLLKGRLGASARKSSHCQKQTPLFHKVSKSMNEKEEGTNYSDIKTLNILVVFFSYPVFIYLLSISIFHTTAFS